MEKYIGVKIVEAQPMSLGDYSDYKHMDYPSGECPERDGYIVRYPDGYESWSPKEVFEGSYMEIEDKTRITPIDVDRFFELKETIKMGEKTTVCRFVCKNGFEIIESSSCVNPNNYNEEMGASICKDRATDKVWLILGSLLQFGKGIK